MRIKYQKETRQKVLLTKSESVTREFPFRVIGNTLWLDVDGKVRVEGFTGQKVLIRVILKTTKTT